ncbi:MAG: hypothetical protein AAF492_17350, partial [Verrucomicrobiota bacterium]
TGGTLLANNGSGSATGSGAVDVRAGATLGGNGFVAGHVILQGGSIAPGGSPGGLTVGSVDFDNASSFLVELGGPTPVSGHDQLAVSGSAMLAGTLDLDYANGFIACPGERYTILTAGSVTGTFDTILSPDTNLYWTVEYGATSVTVVTRPKAIGSNLILWLDAEDSGFTFTSSNNVDVWMDRSTNENHATRNAAAAADGIQRVTNVLSGKAAVRFAGGANDAMKLMRFARIGTAVNEPGGSAFVVAWTDDASGEDTLMGRETFNEQFFRQSNADVVFFNGTPPAVTIASDVTVPRIQYVQFDYAQTPRVRHFVNGVESTVSGADNLDQNGWRLNVVGGRLNGGCCGMWDGDIAEIMLWDRVLTSNELAQVGTYLAQKYGLTTAYPMARDTDGDGLPDKTDPDDDNDGVSDEDETIADTDPLDDTSFLWLNISQTTTASVQLITFPSSTNRVYLLQSKTNLLDPIWSTELTNMPGTGGFMSVPRTNAVELKYYRVGVEVP